MQEHNSFKYYNFLCKISLAIVWDEAIEMNNWKKWSRH